MKTIFEKQAQDALPQLSVETAASHQSIQINQFKSTGGTAYGALISEEDWRSIEETPCLLSVPGMRETIKATMLTPVEKCAFELYW